MDEYNSGMDPQMKRYFRKIMNSFSMGLLWMMGFVTAGLFFHLATPEGPVRWYNMLFYLLAIVTFFLLIRYYYRSWARKE
ncbi:MAG TPA: hypothetical protein VHK91_15335 [Flavisolibacter sp.]|jgi:hypothetical protein|nr:hypothetical protein [Flavisolibacter sp.]